MNTGTSSFDIVLITTLIKVASVLTKRKLLMSNLKQSNTTAPIGKVIGMAVIQPVSVVIMIGMQDLLIGMLIRMATLYPQPQEVMMIGV